MTVPATVRLREKSVPMRDFLTDCVSALSEGRTSRELTTFLTAGAAALAAEEDRWVQWGLETPDLPELHGAIAALARDWLWQQTIDDFFVMHKPPGLRLRLAPAPGQAEHVEALLRKRIRLWQDIGLVTRAVPSVYEPEAHLFGGPASMAWAHRLFTVDSLTWLDHHTRPSGCPPWALSMLMLRGVFDGLRIAGWEDRDVWARVRETGRRHPEPVDTAVAAAGLRRWWNHPDELAATVPGPARRLAERHAEEVRPLLDGWWAHYFTADGARVGPREAACYYVVFHWNRGKLSFGRQVLIAESLAAGDD
ncbi:thiopeptide-type bacteriocin biosynthesis protein [Amycolatopsis thermoflava]|uniref:thiopeptide-type bacteriocin biosynthesis protein n=1 Tax=Amycolatopsis thermoflava TaxID=84480 RepID=UPI00365A9D98